MISTQELSDSLKVTPQRISALSKTVNILDEESALKGRTRLYSRSAVKKLFGYRGVDYGHKRVIAISNNKGGVGKTSIATSLASRLVDLGFEVLVADLDPQANSTMFFLNTEHLQRKVKHVLYDVVTQRCSLDEAIVSVSDGLKVLPSSLLNSRLESQLSSLQKNPATYMANLIKDVDANFIIFDMSPSFSQINFLGSLSSDMVIIPTFLTRFSIEGVQMTLESLREWIKEYDFFRPDVRILINQLDNRLSTQLGYAASLKDSITIFDDHEIVADLFSTVIRADNTINRVQSGQSDLSPASNFYKDIGQLADEIIGLSSLPDEVNQ
jgi:chromosome partitioning protein